MPDHAAISDDLSDVVIVVCSEFRRDSHPAGSSGVGIPHPHNQFNIVIVRDNAS